MQMESGNKKISDFFSFLNHQNQKFGLDIKAVELALCSTSDDFQSLLQASKSMPESLIEKEARKCQIDEKVLNFAIQLLFRWKYPKSPMTEIAADTFVDEKGSEFVWLKNSQSERARK